MQVIEFKAKKIPKQARSKATYDAILDACAQLLEREGYQVITTNHIAEHAGVSIGSLYEYFENKEVITHLLIERVVDQVLSEVNQFALNTLMQGALLLENLQSFIRDWLQQIYSAMMRRQTLLNVIVQQVPQQIKQAPLDKIQQQQLQILQTALPLLSNSIELIESPEEMFITVNLVDSLLTRLVVQPWQDVDAEKVLDLLAERLWLWLQANEQVACASE